MGSNPIQNLLTFKHKITKKVHFLWYISSPNSTQMLHAIVSLEADQASLLLIPGGIELSLYPRTGLTTYIYKDTLIPMFSDIGLFF